MSATGVLCHTISTTTWRNLYFNDTVVGEFGINAALCGHYNCPVVLITGMLATFAGVDRIESG